MKRVEAILATHEVVGGNRDVITRNRKGKLRLAGMHNHLGVDFIGKDPDAALDLAASRGVDVFIATDHDQQMYWEGATGPIERSGMTSIPGMEVTALRRDGKGFAAGHVLVYGVVNPPPEIMPVRDLNVWVHEQGGVTAVAHPTMGHESLSAEQVRAVQRGPKAQAFDLIETNNYGDDQLRQYERMALPLVALAAKLDLSPRSGANDQARLLHEEFQGEENPMHEIGGSDMHRIEDVDGVLVGFEQDLLGEALAGQVVIFRKKNITVPTPLQLLRFSSLDLRERRRWNAKVEEQMQRQREAEGVDPIDALV